MAKAKNFLKNIKDVTAPRRWKSSPDHPPAQLAYVTQDEIDMLVEANIYGSMDGKPNRGPKGIISLQGDLGSWRPSRPSPSGGGGPQGGGPHQDAPDQPSGGSGAPGGITPTTGTTTVTGTTGTTTVTGTTGGTPNPHTDTGFSGGPTLATGAPNPGYEGPTPGTGGVPADGSGYIPPDILNPPPDEETANIIGKPLTALSSYEMNQLKNLMKLYTPYGDLEGIGFWKTLAQMYQDRGDMLFGKGTTYTDEFGTAIDPKDVEVNDEGEYIHKTTKKKVRFTKGGVEDKIKEEMGSDIFNRLQMHSPEMYYPYQGMPQTTGGLEDLAGMDAQKYLDNKDFAQMIFDARNELDRQQGDQGGQGAGIMGAVPTPFTDVNNNGILDSLEVAQAAAPAATTTAAAMAPAATMTAPTPFDYPGPHFTSAYPGHYANLGSAYANLGPNYVNQGLGQWPQFDYWNQIANAFPGMRNYG
mgnify:FL=1